MEQELNFYFSTKEKRTRIMERSHGPVAVLDNG